VKLADEPGFVVRFGAKSGAPMLENLGPAEASGRRDIDPPVAPAKAVPSKAAIVAQVVLASTVATLIQPALPSSPLMSAGPAPPVLLPPLGAAKRSAVPKLTFNGLRPSLQGCSGLGAPPPEEPGHEDHMAPQVTQAFPSTLQPSSVGLEDNGQTWASSSSDDEPQTSQDQIQEQPRRLQPVVPKLSLCVPSGGLSAAAPSPSAGSAVSAAVGSVVAEDADHSVKAAVVSSQHPSPVLSERAVPAVRSLPPVPRTPVLALGSAAHPSTSLPSSSPMREADSSSDESTSRSQEAHSGNRPLREPVPRRLQVVPSLSFNGLRPSLQGCSGLGAPPPEEPTPCNGMAGASPFEAPPIIQSWAPPPLAALPILSQHVSPGQRSVSSHGAFPNSQLSPPPPTNSDSSSDSSDADEPAAVPALPTPNSPEVPTISAAAPTLQRPAVLALGADASGVTHTGDYDSSDEEDEIETQVAPPPLLGSSATAALSSASRRGPTHLLEGGDSSDSSSGSDVEGMARRSGDCGADPSVLGEHCEKGRPTAMMPYSQPGLRSTAGSTSRAPPAPSGLALVQPAGLRPVPKLAFKGIRPSLQGCSGLGAPPPEEPTQEELSAPQLQTPPPIDGHFVPLAAATFLNMHGGGLKDGALTPTNSGQQSPTQAGSAASAPLAPTDLSCAGVIHQNVFYWEGRQRRRIYEDLELHALMLTLIIALLVTPEKGLLDSRYCDQYPLMDHKRNIPYLLSVHLNHGANSSMLPWLFQQADTIGSIGGFCVLKLLCGTAMHRWMYTNWTRVAGGQFGTVYRCNVQLSADGTIAVKQIPKQNNIQDRCVFFDVFSEVVCLDTLRFQGHVCQLYDYGADETGYWIVMKYYSTTLKKWRDSLRGSIADNLPAMLAVYRQVLQAMAVMHRHGIVHYDLKCDNIMIDLDKANQNGGVLSAAVASTAAGAGEEGRAEAPMAVEVVGGQVAQDSAPQVAVADFGESRMMESPDELDMRNRGTEIIKCPEMLELEKFGKKDSNVHDRRKHVGTNASADIWSLGCLLFELLAGRYLFQDDDFGTFWARITGRMQGTDQDVVSDANVERLEGCTPLVEFIRYMLVREPQHRPTISAVLRRYRIAAAEALKWSSKTADAEGGRAGGDSGEPLTPTGAGGAGGQRRDSGATPDSPRSVQHSVGGSSGGGGGARSHETYRPERPLMVAAAGDVGSYTTRVLADLTVLEVSDADLCGGTVLPSRLAQRSWTHVVDFRAPGAAPLPGHLDIPYMLTLQWSSPARVASEFISWLAAILDFLRHAAILRGEVLFVDGHTRSQDGGSSKGSLRSGGLAMAAVLAVVAETFRLDAFSALSYLSSQVLVAAIRPDAVATLAAWQESERRGARQRCQGTVRVACICGCCSWHVPAEWIEAAPEETPPALRHVAGEAYLRWLGARFGVGVSRIRWLLLPEAVNAQAYSDSSSYGSLTRGISIQAERTTEAAPGATSHGVVRRFRCRSCRALTHVELSEGGPGSPERVALVCTYELLRLARLLPAVGDDEGGLPGSVRSWGHALSRHLSDAPPPLPPARLHGTSLADLVLPRSAGALPAEC